MTAINTLIVSKYVAKPKANESSLNVAYYRSSFKNIGKYLVNV